MEINTEEQFEILMREIDKALREENIDIPGRPILAMSEAAKRLKRGVFYLPHISVAIPNYYEGTCLAAHIFKWYDEQYGDRLNMDFSLGSTLYVLNNDPWLVKFQFALGEVEYVCQPDLTIKYPSHCVARKEDFKPPILNILSCIEDIPENIVRKLSKKDQVNFADFFFTSLQTFQAVDKLINTNPLANAIRHDITSSALDCVSSRAEYGQSRWLSLQAAEKSLKLYISQLDAEYSYIHDLSKLYKEAQDLGLTSINENTIKNVQCDANVRYDNTNTSQADATRAHLSSFKITTQVMKALGEKSR